jgi:hypothetical protein
MGQIDTNPTPPVTFNNVPFGVPITMAQQK